MTGGGLRQRRVTATIGTYHADEGIVGHARPGSRRPITATLDEELVHTALLPKRDLNGTLDDPIRELITRERTRRLAQDEAVGEIIDSLDAFHRTHGLLSDEFSSL